MQSVCKDFSTVVFLQILPIILPIFPVFARLFEGQVMCLGSLCLRIERSIYSSVFYGIIMQCAPCEYVCVMWRKERGRKRGRKRELLMDGEAQQCVSSLNGWAWVCPYHTSVCMEYPDDVTFAKYVRYRIPQFLEWRI